MRPWRHALSSAGKIRRWQDDLPVHEFLDSTKWCSAERKHRFVLHHVDLGAELARRAFPDRRDIAELVERHVIEDMGGPVTFADWWAHCDVSTMPAPIRRRFDLGKDGLVAGVARKLPTAAHVHVKAVADVLFLPAVYASHAPDRAIGLLMNAAGPMIVRQIFGPPVELSDAGPPDVIDYAWIAEALTFATFGDIPDLGRILSCLRREPTVGHALSA